MIGPLPYLALAATAAKRPVASVLSVYRNRNAQHVEALRGACDAAGFPLRLWCLDEPTTALASLTVGSGPGSRFALLNELAEQVPPDHWLVICDDDVHLHARRALRAFVSLSARYGFDLAQPAHRPGSHLTHTITAQSRRVVARETTFVEIGPVVAVSPRLRPQLLPFPEDGMGWGVDVQWTDLRDAGYRLGVIDATPIDHLSPPAQHYDRASEQEAMTQELNRRGVALFSDLQRTIRAYRWF